MPYIIIIFIFNYEKYIYNHYKLFFQKTHTDYLNSSLFFDYLQYPIYFELINTIREYFFLFESDPIYQELTFHPSQMDEDFDEDPTIENEFLLLGLSGEVNNPDEAAIFGRLEMNPDCDNYEEFFFLFDEDDFVSESDKLIPNSRAWFFLDLFNAAYYWGQILIASNKKFNSQILVNNIYNTSISKDFDNLYILNNTKWHYFSEKQTFYPNFTELFLKFRNYPKEINEKKIWSNYIPTIENDHFSNYQISNLYLNVESLDTKKDLKGEYYNTPLNYYISYFIKNYNRVFLYNYNINIFTTNLVNNISSSHLDFKNFNHNNIYYLAYEEKIINFQDFANSYQLFFIYGLKNIVSLFHSNEYIAEEYIRGADQTSIAYDLWPFIMNKNDIYIYNKYKNVDEFNEYKYSEYYPHFQDNNCSYYGYLGKFKLNIKKLFFRNDKNFLNFKKKNKFQECVLNDFNLLFLTSFKL